MEIQRKVYKDSKISTIYVGKLGINYISQRENQLASFKCWNKEIENVIYSQKMFLKIHSWGESRVQEVNETLREQAAHSWEAADHSLEEGVERRRYEELQLLCPHLSPSCMPPLLSPGPVAGRWQRCLV